MMICVSVMLAVFLGWPLAFGGGDPTVLQPSRAQASMVMLVEPAVDVPAVEVAPPPKAESCYKRYQREVKQCNGAAVAACRLDSADNWDLCEATGFWPD
jgi:hypothetical protein